MATLVDYGYKKCGGCSNRTTCQRLSRTPLSPCEAGCCRHGRNRGARKHENGGQGKAWSTRAARHHPPWSRRRGQAGASPGRRVSTPFAIINSSPRPLSWAQSHRRSVCQRLGGGERLATAVHIALWMFPPPPSPLLRVLLSPSPLFPPPHCTVSVAGPRPGVDGGRGKGGDAGVCNESLALSTTAPSPAPLPEDLLRRMLTARASATHREDAPEKLRLMKEELKKSKAKCTELETRIRSLMKEAVVRHQLSPFPPHPCGPRT